MKYAVDSYLKAKAKWGRINDMTEDIERTMSQRYGTETRISKLFEELMVDLASKRTEIKGVTYIRQGWNSKENHQLYINDRGFSYIPYGVRTRRCEIDKSLFKLISDNKDKILETISNRKQDKKEILSIFSRIWAKHKYEFNPINISFAVNKTITDSTSKELERIKILSVSTQLYDNSIRITYKTEKDTNNLNSTDVEENMIKEQLYLPLWKLLTKAKRRANRELRKIERMDEELRRELTPFLVDRQI